MSIRNNIHRFVTRNQLRPADVVVVDKREFRLLDHYVVYLGKNDYGEHIFVANMIGDGVRVLTRSELSLLGVKYIPTRIRRFQGSASERRQALDRAIDNLGEGYNLITYNCEHYANKVQHGRSYSQQTQIGGGILLGAALLGLAAWAFSGNGDDEGND